MKKSNVLGAKAAGAGALALLLATSAFADNRPQDETRRVREPRDGSATNSSQLRTGSDSRDSQNNGSQRDRANGAYQRDNAGVTQRDSATATQRDGRDQAYRAESRDNNSYNNNGYRGSSSARGAYDRSGSSSRSASPERARTESARSYRNNERVQMQGHITRYSHEHGGYRLWLDNGAYSYWVPESHWRSNWRVGIDIVLGGVYRDGTIYADVYDNPYGGGPGYAQQLVSGYVDRVDYRTGTLLVRDDRSGSILTVDTRSIDPRYSRIDGRDLRRGDRVTFEGTWLRGGVFAADRVDSVNAGRY